MGTDFGYVRRWQRIKVARKVAVRKPVIVLIVVLFILAAVLAPRIGLTERISDHFGFDCVHNASTHETCKEQERGEEEWAEQGP